MDPQKTPTFSEDLSIIISQLPAPVQDFFASGEIDVIAKNLMQKNQLHIDQGTVVEREIIMLLLGLKNPDEFTKALSEEAKLDQEMIGNIVQDVNTKIFIPLRAEEMKAGGMNKEEHAPLTASKPVGVVPPVGVPQVSPSGTTQPASHFHLENKIPLRPAPPPMMPRAIPPPLKTVSGMARPSMIEAPKAVDNSRILEDHEEPHIEFGKKTVPAIAPSRTAPPPQNLPGAIQSRIIPAGARPSFIVAPNIESPVQPPANISQGSAQSKPILPTASIVPAVSPTPPKPYATDPYREPIE